MANIRSLSVYCGARAGTNPLHRAAARELGRALAERGIELVFGGGRVGMMGIVADACLAAGGRVVGIIPRLLVSAEVAHAQVTELLVVENMHERKRRMVERADAVAALPGALGTLDELMEMATWRQIGLHDLPIVLLDVEGYWQPLLRLVDHAIAEGYGTEVLRSYFTVARTVEEMLAALADAPAPRFAFQERWA
ncbi:cytokinin riboside 5'-monophosphate phosphoribohydrolase [Allostella vacuolata]|nr:cytokinin riboside 5'-monophosphate phosphoribohydrolase [Stella vacuolata]